MARTSCYPSSELHLDSNGDHKNHQPLVAIKPIVTPDQEIAVLKQKGFPVQASFPVFFPETLPTVTVREVVGETLHLAKYTAIPKFKDYFPGKCLHILTDEHTVKINRTAPTYLA